MGLAHRPIATRHTLTVTELCGLTVGWRKTWLWGTTTSTAETAKTAILEEVQGTEVQRLQHSRDPGLELQYSGTHRLGHRQQRHDKGIKRLQKLMAQPFELTVKEHIIHTSIFPATFYGAEICPVSEELLTKIRSLTADALLGKSRSMSPGIALLLTKHEVLDPTFFVMCQAFRTAMGWY